MVEKNSGVPPIVEVPVPIPVSTPVLAEPNEPSVQTKRVRKSKGKQDNEPALPDPEKQQPVQVDAGDPHKEPEHEPEPAIDKRTLNKPVKRYKYRPLPPIEHKRVVHYYREVRAINGKTKKHHGQGSRDGGGSRSRGAREETNNVDDDDDDELLSDSDWNVDSDSSGSSDESDSEDGSDGEKDVSDAKRAKHKDSKTASENRRDESGRYTPVNPVTQYRVV